MIRRKQSLSAKKQISYVLKRGKRHYGSILSFFYIPKRLHEQSKLLCLLSKKKTKKAVDRNKIRRQIQSLYLRNQQNLGKYILIVSLKHKHQSVPFETLQEDFDQYVKHHVCL